MRPRKKSAAQSTNTSIGRKRNHSSSSHDSVFFERQPVQPLEKKARRELWTDDLKTTLLKGRLQLNHVFEDNNEYDVQLAWNKIAATLDTTFTEEECVQMFDSLVKSYLKKQQTLFEDVPVDSQEWQHYQTLEKLFLSSPRLAEFYDSVELSPVKDSQVSNETNIKSDYETSEIAETISLELANYNSSFAKYFDHIKKSRERQKKQEDRLTNVLQDVIHIRRENMIVMSEFLKRILFNFSKLDELAKRESLEAITSIFPGVFSMSSAAIPIVTEYLESTERENQLFESINVFLLTFSRSVHHMFDTTDEEEAFYLQSIPYHEQYFEKPTTVSPERLTNHSSMSDFDFKGHLRITRSTMEGFIAKIGVRFKKPTNYEKLAGKNVYINVSFNQTYISIERQSLVFMWYLTHNETYEQLALRFAVPLAEVVVILHYFIELITGSQLDFIKWPKGNLEQREVISEFESMRTDAFPGVIGAIGTKYLSVKSPAWFRSDRGGVSKNETIKQLIAVQAIANAKHIIMDVHTAWIELSYSVPGQLKPVSTEETKAVTRYKPEDVFSNSPFHIMQCRRRKEGVVSTTSLKADTHVVADETYPLMESVMVPYGKTQEDTPAKSLFDQQLHQTRSVIEVAFGKLINRFSRLRNMDHTLQYSEGLIKACIGIHNFCLKAGDDFSPREVKLPELDIVREPQVDETAVAKRDKICEEINSGKIRYIYRDAEPTDPVVETPVP
uniref:DDE Tnp4 domain-containing protein n=1 Tax=Lygus hesperus TaxID=30085 RepID=A0A146MCI3_LYGHE